MPWSLYPYILESVKSKNKNKREGLSIQGGLLDRIWQVLKYIAKHIMQILIFCLKLWILFTGILKLDVSHVHSWRTAAFQSHS